MGVSSAAVKLLLVNLNFHPLHEHLLSGQPMGVSSAAVKLMLVNLMSTHYMSTMWSTYGCIFSCCQVVARKLNVQPLHEHLLSSHPMGISSAAVKLVLVAGYS